MATPEFRPAGAPDRELHHRDARALAFADGLADVAEAFRVLKPGGRVVAAGISRFASMLAGLSAGLLDDPEYVAIVRQDLRDGQHRNPTDKPYFTTAFFHHPDELREELVEAGFTLDAFVAVEGRRCGCLASRPALPFRRSAR